MNVCIKNEKCCIKNEEFRIKMMNVAGAADDPDGNYSPRNKMRYTEVLSYLQSVGLTSCVDPGTVCEAAVYACP